MNEIYRWYGKEEWIPRHELSYVWWTYFVASNYQALPFEGGIADQPTWIWYDFSHYEEMAEFEQLMFEREELQRRLTGRNE